MGNRPGTFKGRPLRISTWVGTRLTSPNASRSAPAFFAKARRGWSAALLLRCEQVLDAAQGEGVAGDAEAGDDALADRRGLRGRAAPDRVRDVHLDRRVAHLGNRRYQRRIAAAEGGR